MVTDQSQAVVWQTEQTPFGEVSQTGTLSQPLRFPGQYTDPETGYSYNYFRDYDPSVGRYVQSDPIGLDGGFNTYAYVYGNPFKYSDPYGLWGIGDPLPQPVVDGAAGFGDGMSGGGTALIRRLLGNDDVVNRCSPEYSGSHTAGAASSLGLGAGRLVYAGLARGYSAIASSGTAASTFRSRLRVAFGGGYSLRPPNLARYAGNDDALRRAAGRTNPFANGTGAAATGAGATGLGGDGCGCDQ